MGDLLAFGRQSSATLGAWLERQDAEFIGQLRREAGLRGESIAEFLRVATADFLAEADAEDWASLVSALRETDDPGAVCVARVTAFRLRLERSA
ncbi:hypothetical protein [Terricaulis sp.]|uniref:hypothetical protein n=1 Tax=Terricaulis sp. TaxID=2768686 RepID=UPI0037839538